MNLQNLQQLWRKQMCIRDRFNVYHSNTQDHKWELLKTFSCSLKVGHFSDIRVEGEKNQVGIAFEDNRVERTENTVSYYGDDVDTYEFNIDGFNGWIGSFKTFEVKDIDGEQFYRDVYKRQSSNQSFATKIRSISISSPCRFHFMLYCFR